MNEQHVKGVDYTGICVTFLCHDGQGSLIMNRRSIRARDEHGKWDIGAGGLEFGEKIEDCLVREIKEEYCCDIVDYQFLGYRDVHRTHDSKATHWISLDFIVQIDRSQAAIGDPDKMDEIAWFSLDTMPADEDRHSQAPLFWQMHNSQISTALKKVSQTA